MVLQGESCARDLDSLFFFVCVFFVRVFRSFVVGFGKTQRERETDRRKNEPKMIRRPAVFCYTL